MNNKNLWEKNVPLGVPCYSQDTKTFFNLDGSYFYDDRLNRNWKELSFIIILLNKLRLASHTYSLAIIHVAKR